VREHSTLSPETQNSPCLPNRCEKLHRGLPARYRVAATIARRLWAPAGGSLRACTRRRGVPRPDSPPLEIRLPWETPDGEPTTARLLLYSRERKAMDRNHFNAYVWKTAVWKTALAASGIEPSRANGMHALRHFYVSVLLDAGESSRRSRSISGTATPASRCGPTPTCCRPANSSREGRSTACPRPRSGTDPHFRWSAARDA
jgi:hypothetical protein